MGTKLIWRNMHGHSLGHENMQRKGGAYIQRVFSAYYQEEKDIGKVSVLTSLAAELGNSTNCAPYSAVEVRLGGVDGTLIGTIPVPPTASGWGPYKIATGQLTEALIGVLDVYFVLTGSTDSTYKYIGNFDRAEFTRL
ncbi:carbohydrate-binding protein [Paenibacillus lautus]|uniref:carbohydrate-binding protein n=1 Tax=Paenibacillus lautus TaxID=1401 RepID=UPI003D2B9822